MVRRDLLSARFNLREAASHLALLEDHLAIPDRRCGDCCRKHVFLSRAWLNEAWGLKPSSADATIAGELGEALDRAWRLLYAGAEPAAVAAELRRSRKRWLPLL